MKVILLQDVKNLGKENELINVKPGYARNFLFPNSLAVSANELNLKKAEEEKKKKDKLAEEKLKETQEIVSKLDGLEVEISAKTGKKSEVFGSINKTKISQALSEMGYQIKPAQIDLKESIKETGEFPVKIIFSHNLEAEIKVIIISE